MQVEVLPPYIVDYETQSFKDFLKRVLSLGITKDKLNIVVNDETVKLFQIAFTHKSVSPNSNYEKFEFMGDTTANKCITWYLATNLTIQGTGVEGLLTTLKHKLISTFGFAGLADRLGFYEWISASGEIREKRKKSLEDTFEAFCGVTESLLDNLHDVDAGVGYAIMYKIIKTLLDDTPITTDYWQLRDAVSVLKEMVDAGSKDPASGMIRSTKVHKGNPYTNELQNEETKLHTVTIVFMYHGQAYEIGKGVEFVKQVALNHASKQAIDWLSARGYPIKYPAWAESLKTMSRKGWKTPSQKD